MAEPLPTTTYGPASWLNWTHNWRKEDGDFLQYRGILRYATDGDRPGSPQTGQTVYVQATDTVSVWSGEWIPLLSSKLLRLATSGTGSTGTATLSHISAGGAGLVFSNTKLRSSLDFITSQGFQADTVSIFTAAGGGNRTARLTTSPVNLISDSPILAPSLTLNGAAGADVLTLSAGNLRVGGAVNVTGALNAPLFLNVAQSADANAATRKDYVDGQDLAYYSGLNSAKVNKAGDVVTGDLYLTAAWSSHPNAAMPKNYIDYMANSKVSKTGGDFVDGTLWVIRRTTDNFCMRLLSQGEGPAVDFLNYASSVQFGYIRMAASDALFNFNGGGHLQITPTLARLYSESGDVVLQTGAGRYVDFNFGGGVYGRVYSNIFLYGKSAQDVAAPGFEMNGLYSGANGSLRSTMNEAANTNLYIRRDSGAVFDGADFAQFLTSYGAGLGIAGAVRIVGGGTGVAFLTGSDYRIKNVLGPVENALDQCRALTPRLLEFKAQPGQEFVGFLAHEVQAVMPTAVSGEKDALYTAEEADAIAGIEEGDPKIQQLDMSKLVPLITAGLQELTAALQELTHRVTALEEAA